MQGKKKLTSFSNAEETAVTDRVLFHFLLEDAFRKWSFIFF
jgi:hypothetical protein